MIYDLCNKAEAYLPEWFFQSNSRVSVIEIVQRQCNVQNSMSHPGTVYTRLHLKICPAQDVSNLYPASSPYPSLSPLFAICAFLGSGSLLADPVHPPVATVPIPCAFLSLRSMRIPSMVFPGASGQEAPSTLVENRVHSARIRTGVRHNRATWFPAVYIHNRME